MSSTLTSGYYRAHFESIQRAKYAMAWPKIAPLLQPRPLSLLDVGIGPGWFETFVKEQNRSFSRLVGVDIDAAAIQPANPDVTYVLDPHFQTEEQFDLVVCWDAWHTCPHVDLMKMVKPNGLLVVSEPRAFADQLNKLSWQPLVDEWVGEQEKSRVVVARNYFLK